MAKLEIGIQVRQPWRWLLDRPAVVRIPTLLIMWALPKMWLVRLHTK